ncbi:hypothetical protein JJV70_08380 [Streptomyces sp. JJ66]|uniref:hypothetical protein n=1 Tax=Streptomyces sp. JJ66 TaxID=2803843 RepID=UPI001C58FABE|nr:hypothetical protein [Streptomyces sp. JJ66]MBW1602130.1 hypothetical protein [Streptomyces sp. JJ66]
MDAGGLGQPAGWRGAWFERLGVAPTARRARWAGFGRLGVLSARGGERLRARAPGVVLGAEPEPGGGRVRFERSVLRVRVTVGGAVFLGWDGSEPEAGGAAVNGVREPDGRATLEPDADSGWRVVSQRVRVVVTRRGEVRLRTPGGVLLRRDGPPLWWERQAGGGGPWLLRSELTADARVRNLTRAEAGGGGLGPVQLVVAAAGSHLVGPGRPLPARLTVREGSPGAGSGHDRPGRAELRAAGGTPGYWVVVGSPERVLRDWAALTAGAPHG